ncbi:hypothetical protein CDAR_282251 [Caerostris darwini]|uniref:Uncharacterized protein n=1 Tax=Caerostris darwini TaxID=1538125 RepID=A0AAV4VFZ3_9ARAC|nr:hypothetical protein CDAR_282251 [Caerostris darwini]
MEYQYGHLWWIERVLMKVSTRTDITKSCGRREPEYSSLEDFYKISTLKVVTRTDITGRSEPEYSSFEGFYKISIRCNKYPLFTKVVDTSIDHQ